MKTLRLPLTTQWFYLTKQGIKTEDYREITPYWIKRLCRPLDEDVSAEDVMYYLLNSDKYPNSSFEFLSFTKNIMTLGYPKSTDTEKILEFEHKGIEVRTGNPEWVAEPNKLYFVILHGKRITD